DLSLALRPADRWPSFDLRAFRLSHEHYRLCMDFSLLCLDAASMCVVLEDWRLLYEESKASLPELMPRAFEAGVRAGIGMRSGERHRRAMAYWEARCPNFETAPRLPFARDLDSIWKHRSLRYEGRLDIESWGRLKDRAQARGLTPTIVLCTAFVE